MNVIYLNNYLPQTNVLSINEKKFERICVITQLVIREVTALLEKGDEQIGGFREIIISRVYSLMRQEHSDVRYLIECILADAILHTISDNEIVTDFGMRIHSNLRMLELGLQEYSDYKEFKSGKHFSFIVPDAQKLTNKERKKLLKFSQIR